MRPARWVARVGHGMTGCATGRYAPAELADMEWFALTHAGAGVPRPNCPAGALGPAPTSRAANSSWPHSGSRRSASKGPARARFPVRSGARPRGLRTFAPRARDCAARPGRAVGSVVAWSCRSAIERMPAGAPRTLETRRAGGFVGEKRDRALSRRCSSRS